MTSIGIAGGFGAGFAVADFPHLMSARSQLDGAVNELQQAPDDFGGHKGQAINLINQAKNEIDQGIQYREQHPGGVEQNQPPQPGFPGFPGGF
jgi:hypothetical protein